MKTIVIAVRHAKPADPGTSPNDEDRPLVAEGRVTQERMARVLRSEGYHADFIVSSPFLRAEQTAEILHRIMGGEVVGEKGLGDPFDGEAVLSKIIPGKTTILVGHEPSLPKFVNQLVGTDALPYGMAKSSAAIITIDGKVSWGHGTLEAYKEPS